MRLRNEHGVNAIIARPWNTYGPRDYFYDESFAHVIPRMMRRIMDGKSLEVIGGKQTRTFCHVSDLARMFILMAESENHKDHPYSAYNLGSEEEVTMDDLAGMILDASNMRSGCFIVRKNEGAVGYSRRLPALDFLKERISPHQIPSRPLQTGLRETWEWLKNGGN